MKYKVFLVIIAVIIIAVMLGVQYMQKHPKTDITMDTSKMILLKRLIISIN